MDIQALQDKATAIYREVEIDSISSGLERWFWLTMNGVVTGRTLERWSIFRFGSIGGAILSFSVLFRSKVLSDVRCHARGSRFVQDWWCIITKQPNVSQPRITNTRLLLYAYPTQVTKPPSFCSDDQVNASPAVHFSRSGADTTWGQLPRLNSKVILWWTDGRRVRSSKVVSQWEEHPLTANLNHTMNKEWGMRKVTEYATSHPGNGLSLTLASRTVYFAFKVYNTQYTIHNTPWWRLAICTAAGTLPGGQLAIFL